MTSIIRQTIRYNRPLINLPGILIAHRPMLKSNYSGVAVRLLSGKNSITPLPKTEWRAMVIPSKFNCGGVRFMSSKSVSTDDTTKVGDESVQKPKIDRSTFDKLVRTNKVVVFMKGTPRSPRCGFSNAVVQVFRMHGVEYDAHDVLADAEIREGIKAYTDWPTIPQVFIGGEFVGGCDILLEMHQNGELIEELGKAGIVSELLRIHEEVQEKANKEKKNKRKD